MKRVIVTLLTLLWWGSGDSCAAESPTATPTVTTCELPFSLEEFRAFALKESPYLTELERERVAQAARAFETAVLANPEVAVEQTYTRMDLGGDNDHQTNVSIGQTIRLSQFGARNAFARLITQAGEVEKKAKLLEFQQQLTSTFYSLYILQELQQVVAVAAGRAASGVEQVKRAVSQGLLSEGDEGLFEGELFRLQSQQLGLQSRMESLQAEISRMIGSRCRVKAREIPPTATLPSAEALLDKAKESELSESSRIELLVQLAHEQSRVAELDVFPAFTPKVLYQHTNDGGDFVGAGLAIPLPLWNRNQAENLKAQAELNAARTRRDFLLNGAFEAQVARARAAAEYAHGQSQAYVHKVVPAFQRAFRAQERLYTQGKGSVVQVWQTLRAYSEAQEQALALQMQAVQARTQLSLLVGEEV